MVCTGPSFAEIECWTRWSKLPRDQGRLDADRIKQDKLGPAAGMLDDALVVAWPSDNAGDAIRRSIEIPSVAPIPLVNVLPRG